MESFAGLQNPAGRNYVADFSLKLFRFFGKPGFEKLMQGLLNELGKEKYVSSVNLDGKYLDIKIREQSYLDIMDTSLKACASLFMSAYLSLSFPRSLPGFIIRHPFRRLQEGLSGNRRG